MTRPAPTAAALLARAEKVLDSIAESVAVMRGVNIVRLRAQIRTWLRKNRPPRLPPRRAGLS